MEHKLIDGIERPQIPVKDWGTDQMGLRDVTAIAHVTEIHHKSEGAVDDTPSLALIVDVPYTNLRFAAEISMYTLEKALSQLGYQITFL